MNLRIQPVRSLVALWPLLLAGCAQVDAQPSAQASTPTTLQTQVQSLLKRSVDTLVFLPGGTFEMGDWGNELGERYALSTASQPLHKVTLDGFSMQKYKVTYADFDLFTEATGRTRINSTGWRAENRDPRYPAPVNWYGAKAYCQWLAAQTKLPFDLPTEAQWEYAARSGGKRVFFATDNGWLEEGRNYPSYEQQTELGKERGALWVPVGLFPPNPAGLVGMQEISSEWMDDWFGPYTAEPVTNPRGPATGDRKAQRGISGSPSHQYVFNRLASYPDKWARQEGIPPEIHMHQDFSSYPGAGTLRCVVNSPRPVR